MLEVDGELYVVSGRNVYRRQIDGTITNLGTVGGASTAGMVTMARNRAATPQIAIVVDHLGYIVQGGVLSSITDPDFPTNVNSVAHLDGYFIFYCDDAHVQLSNVDDGFTIDPLKNFRSEANARLCTELL